MKFPSSALRHWVWVYLFLGSGLWASTCFAATLTGQLVGRVSAKPLAGAWVCLGRVTQDQEGKDAKIELTEFSAVSDGSGRFTLPNVPAGEYTFVYRPAPGGPLKGVREINVRDLSRLMRSFMPMLRDTEVGAREPFPDRPWSAFTLLKGHTLFCIALGGAYMKIWNATVRSGRQGPYLEMRRNQIWKQKMQSNTQLNLQAWSY